MSAKTTKVTLLATTVLLSALYQSHAFASELPTEPNAIIKISDVKNEATDEVTSSEVVTNSSSTEESNGEVSSETPTTAPIAADDVTSSETVTNSNTSDTNSDVVSEQGDSTSSNDTPAASDAVSTSVGDVSTVENVNSEPAVNLVASSDDSVSVLPQAQTESNASAITNTVVTSANNSASSSNTQNSSSDSSGGNSAVVSNDASSGEVDDVSTVAKESEAAIPRSVIAKAPVQAASSLGLSSISNVVSSKSTIGQKLFFGLILALMFAFGFSTYNKKKKNDLSYL